MIVNMSKFGTALSSRVSGRKAYDEIIRESVSLSTPVVFDFEGVTLVTNSFADEVFGRMTWDMGIDAMRSRTSFKNVNPFWGRIIRGAIDLREEQRSKA